VSAVPEETYKSPSYLFNGLSLSELNYRKFYLNVLTLTLRNICFSLKIASIRMLIYVLRISLIAVAITH